MKKTIAIIVAAGSSSRMGEAGDKLFADLCGKPVLQYSIEAFKAAKSVDDIVVVCSAEAIERVRGLCDSVTVVEGGRNRAESVLCGINAVNYTEGIAAIHDGARPLITPELIDTAVENYPCILAIPVKDTVKQVKDGFIEATPDRDSLYLAQTPQVFDLQTYRNARSCDVTDDSALMERMGVMVRIIQGDERNIKITTPQDLEICRGLLNGAY